MAEGKKEEQQISAQEEKLIERAKKISVKEGSAHSVMEGFGSRYITPFALAIGANNAQIGLLNCSISFRKSLAALHTP